MKNWSKLSLVVTISTIVGLGSASNAQSIFDKCLQQLSDDDISSAKNSANTIKRLSGITGSNIIKAEECLSGVMGLPSERVIQCSSRGGASDRLRWF